MGDNGHYHQNKENLSKPLRVFVPPPAQHPFNFQLASNEHSPRIDDAQRLPDTIFSMLRLELFISGSRFLRFTEGETEAVCRPRIADAGTLLRMSSNNLTQHNSDIVGPASILGCGKEGFAALHERVPVGLDNCTYLLIS